MNIMKSFLVALVAVSVLVHYYFYSENSKATLAKTIADLENRNSVLRETSQASNQIYEDQIRELVTDLQNVTAEKNLAKTEGFIAGAVDATSRPDRYQAVWHSGYDRGTENQKEMDKAVEAIKK